MLATHGRVVVIHECVDRPQKDRRVEGSGGLLTGRPQQAAQAGILGLAPALGPFADAMSFANGRHAPEKETSLLIPERGGELCPAPGSRLRIRHGKRLLPE